VEFNAARDVPGIGKSGWKSRETIISSWDTNGVWTQPASHARLLFIRR